MSDSTSCTRTIFLNLKQGLHIRACSQVVALVTPYAGSVKIIYNGQTADASSMFDLIQLAVLPDSEVSVDVDGPGAEKIMDQLETLFSLEVLPVE